MSYTTNEKEQMWRFTFGCGQKHEGYCQPIIGTFNSARRKMFEVHGTKWGFQYSEEEWKNMQNDPDRHWELEKDMEVIRA